MHLEENLNKEFKDDTEKNLQIMYLFTILLMTTRFYQLIKRKQIGKQTLLQISRCISYYITTVFLHIMKHLLLTESEQFQEYYKDKYMKFLIFALQHQPVFSLVRFVSLILKNEDTVIQSRELRNQNSPIFFTIENQVQLCPVYKNKQVPNENSLYDLIKDQELV